jgi:PTH2 family peptidyl-tRNA hydrolase
MKQIIVVRTDLKMKKGKMCSQTAHASIAAFLKAKKTDKEKWVKTGMKKVVLKVSGEKELKKICKIARDEKIKCEMIRDAGLTQVEPGSITALGIGPADDKKIDKITGKLKLL